VQVSVLVLAGVVGRAKLMNFERSDGVTAPGVPFVLSTLPLPQPVVPEIAKVTFAAETDGGVSEGSVAPRSGVVVPPVIDAGVSVKVTALSTGCGSTVSVPVATAVPGGVALLETVSVYVQTRLSVVSVPAGGFTITMVVPEVPTSAVPTVPPPLFVTGPVQ